MGVNEFIQVGSRIKKYRKERGLTQKEMAALCGIPYSTYSNYENNNREPSLTQLQIIADNLGIELPKLISIHDFSRKYDEEKAQRELKEWISTMEETKSDRINDLFDSLNDAGQDKAIEQLELLVKIPEYQKKINS